MSPGRVFQLGTTTQMDSALRARRFHSHNVLPAKARDLALLQAPAFAGTTDEECGLARSAINQSWSRRKNRADARKSLWSLWFKFLWADVRAMAGRVQKSIGSPRRSAPAR